MCYDRNDNSDAAIRDAVHSAGGRFDGKYDDDDDKKESRPSRPDPKPDNEDREFNEGSVLPKE